MAISKLFLDLLSSFPLKVEDKNCVNQPNLKACDRCAAVCPHGAITLEGNRPKVDFEKCTLCGLCFAECPVRVFEVEYDLTGLFTEGKHLSVGCFLSDDRVAVKVPCLALLNGELLAALAIHHGGKVVLDASACGRCPQGEKLLPFIRSHAEEASLLLHYHRAEGEVVLSEGEVDLSELEAENEVSLLLGEEKPKPSVSERLNLPLWRQLFFERVKLIEPSRLCEREVEEPRLRFATPKVDRGRCQGSGVCAFWCPTRALSADAEGVLYFTQVLCTDCGLCEKVCPNSALRLEKKFVPRYNSMGARRAVARGRAAVCPSCGRRFTAPEGEELCLYCRKERKVEDLIKRFLEGEDGPT
ncbi:MAG: 4Fe-4S dicluster domain-containing protein [Aquificae bacterium]|nr:4Fe-4S dicluster domain-containing protein [Aquificota bacterium]